MLTEKMDNIRALSAVGIWGLSEDDSPETVSQAALRNCSEEVQGLGHSMCDETEGHTTQHTAL